MEQTADQGPSVREVGAWYDRLGDLYSLTMGDNMHLGMWDDGMRPEPGRTLSAEEAWQELTAAQDRWTDELIDELALGPGERALDVGCGTGRPAVRLARASGGQVLGITASGAQVEQARDRAARAGFADRTAFLRADAMNLPFEDASFDAVWAIESFAHFADRPRALHEARRVLRPGGRLVLADCFEHVPFTDQDVALFRAGFALARLPASLDDYPSLVRQAGFTIDRVRDRTNDFTPTYHLITEIFAARRGRIEELLGTDTAARLDSAYPLILDLCRDKMGYIMVRACAPSR